MRRTAPEEVNLATNAHPQDSTKAKFVRTYMSVTIPVLSLVRRYEQEAAQETKASTWMTLREVPKTGDNNEKCLQLFLTCMIFAAAAH